MSDIGTEFENDLAEFLGLERVAGSGNQWHNRLDVKGRGTRWSLKATNDTGFRLDEDTLNEARGATEGIGGSGEIPVWAVRILSGDFVVIGLSDFRRLVVDGEFSVPATKAEQRRKRALTPQLGREE